MPLGRAVVVHLKSKDVVHSFYLPNFRVKQDVLPDIETRVWFAAKLHRLLRARLRAALRRQPLQDARLVTVESTAAFDALAAHAVAGRRAQRFDEADARRALGLAMGIVNRVFSRDHKVIARQFLWLGLVLLAVGGGMALVMRWSLAIRGRAMPLFGHVVTPSSYTTLFTLHGTIMIFFAVTPILDRRLRQLLHPAA